METREKILENQCSRMARAAGWTAVKLEKNGHKGIPDRLFLNPDGRYVLVEFKKDEKQKPRPEQQTWLGKFQKHAHLVGSLQQFCAIFGLDLPP